MDENSALKYIFRGEYKEDIGLITFNNHKYNYKEHNKEKQCFYLHIMNEEEKITEHKTNIGPQFDALSIDVQKITEEQFFEWKKTKSVDVKTGKMTGKTIYLEKKKENPENDNDFY